MKQITFLLFIVLFSTVALLAQDSNVKVVPVEESKPFVPTKDFFENLQNPAQMNRMNAPSEKDIKFNLDIFSSILSKENKTVEYVFWLDSNAKENLSKNMQIIFSYMTKTKKIAAEKLTFAVGAGGEHELEFWLIPNNRVELPMCDGCKYIGGEDAEGLGAYFPVTKSSKN